MNNEKYFVISTSEDGDIRIYEQTEKDVLKMLKEYEDFLPDIITGLKGQDDPKDDPMYWGDSMLIIKGKIVVPTPKETVKEWEIE